LKHRGTLHTRRNRGQLRGSCIAAIAAPHYNANALKGVLQLAATTRTTRERPQHRDPQATGRQFRGDTKRRRIAESRRQQQQRRRPLHVIKRGAAQQAAVTETGRLSRRPLRKQGGRCRRPLQEAAGGRCRRPLQEQCPGAGGPNTVLCYTVPCASVIVQWAPA
jgi:hypothetical protein